MLDRAGADEHRHRPAGARLPGRAAGRVRPAPARCSSTTRRTRSAPDRAAARAAWGLRARRGHDRQVDRGRRPDRRLRRDAPRSPTRIDAPTRTPTSIDTGGVGGTLAGNALSLAAARATLGEVLTDAGLRADARARRALRRRRRATSSPRTACRGRSSQLGARAEYRFAAQPPRTGGEAAARRRPGSRTYLHLFLLNRGVMHHAVPQHGADVAGDDGGRRRPAHGGIRGAGGGAGGRLGQSSAPRLLQFAAGQ